MRHSPGSIQEAIQLREFGLTQQKIADVLKVPQQTVSYWLSKVGNGIAGNIGKAPPITNAGTPTLPTSITLFQAKYEDVNNRISPESIDLILTDPPYLVSSANIGRNNQNDLQRDFGSWDKVTQKKYASMVRIWAGLIAKHLKKGGSLYLFMGLRQLHLWQSNLAQQGLTDNGLLIWHRTNPAPQIRKTRWCPSFDMILFYSKGSPKTFWWIGQNEMHNVIEGPICAGNERQWHPTQKPRWLLLKLLRVSSEYGDTILDPFAGSGSTAFTATRLPSRQVILVEPDPKYIGLIQSIAKEEFQCQVTLEKI